MTILAVRQQATAWNGTGGAWPCLLEDPMHPMVEHRDRRHGDERDTRTRVVMDGHGTEWMVHEVETPQPWARAARCLIFSSASVVRRVWRYPGDWATLPSRDLLRLVEQGGPAA